MIEINLLPSEYRPKAAPKFVVPKIEVKKTFWMMAGVIFGIQLLLTLFAVSEMAQSAYVGGRIAQLTRDGGAVAKQKEDILSTGERIRKINTITEKKYYWSRVLNALSDSTTKGIWLTHSAVVDVKAGDVKASPKATKVLKLSGSVIGQGEETAFVGKFIKELKANPVFADLFSSIELSNMLQKKIREFDVYDFNLECAFKPEKSS